MFVAGWLETIEGTPNREGASVQDMGVDHGGANVLVSQQGLHSADVRAVFEEVGGEGLPEGVG